MEKIAIALFAGLLLAGCASLTGNELADTEHWPEASPSQNYGLGAQDNSTLNGSVFETGPYTPAESVDNTDHVPPQRH